MEKNGITASSRKKILASLIIIFVVAVITGCPSSRQSLTTQTLEIVTEETINIVFAHKSVNSYFYTIMNEAVKRAAEEKGWLFEISVADYDPMRQNQQILNFIDKKPDAILTTAVDSIAMESVILKANEAGIPLCTIDTNASGGALALDISFDNYHAGQLAAQEIIDRLTEKYGEPKGVVFNAYGKLSSNAWRLRKEGFESVILNCPDITYIPQATEGQPQKVKKALLAAYESYPVIDAVHASSEHPGRGMVEVLQETGRWHKSGDAAHVILVTIDGEPYFTDLIKEGYADAAISQDVIAYGNIAIDLLDKYVLRGITIPAGKYKMADTYWQECDISVTDGRATVTIPAYVVDRDNCDETTHWAYTAQNIWGFQYNK